MLAQGVAAWMERLFVPRGYEFVVKTARMFAEHGAPGRAMQLRLAALTADRPDVWAMAQDLVKYFDTTSTTSTRVNSSWWPRRMAHRSASPLR